ncbi:MAG: hypothetical protein ACK5MP_14195 [Nostocoides sp.]
MTPIVSFAGASGGLGTSTVAAAYALLDAAPDSHALVDLDPRGRIDVVCGCDHLPGLRWPDLHQLSGPPEAAQILARLPRCDGVRVLAGGAGPTPSQQVRREVIAALADQVELLVLDVGRAVEQVPELIGIGQLVVVCGVGAGGLADVDAVVADVTNGFVLTRGTRRLARLGERIAEHCGLPSVGHLVDDPHIRRDLERGLAPRRHLRGVATRLRQALEAADATTEAPAGAA